MMARSYRKVGEEEIVIVVDIAADLNDEDDTGLVWTFLDEARDAAIVVPGATVVAGDAEAPAVAEVVDLIDKPVGTIVHLRLLPGTFNDYDALIQRSTMPVREGDPRSPDCPDGTLTLRAGLFYGTREAVKLAVVWPASWSCSVACRNW
jgi:hypothetical protein